MFATKEDVLAWLKEFAGGLQLEPRKQGKYWRIFDADGFLLTEERIHEMEISLLD